MKVQMIITLDSSDAQAVIDKLEEMEQECETKHAFSVEIEPIKRKGINMNKETNDKMEWVDPELIAAGMGMGDGPSTPRKAGIEKITLDHWRVKEWIDEHHILCAGRNESNEVLVVSFTDTVNSYTVTRFFMGGDEVQVSVDESGVPAWKVFETVMKQGGYTFLRKVMK